MEITIQDAVNMVKERIRRAFLTLAMLPDDKPKQLRCLTPVYLEWGKKYGLPTEQRAKPTAKDIDEMDEVLYEWLPYLPQRMADICYLRAIGVPNKVIAKEQHCSTERIKKKYREALERLVWIISQKEK